MLNLLLAITLTLGDLPRATTPATIAPTMYGAFFEDINFAADGGLYAEQVINRSFEFPQPLMGWRSFGEVRLGDDGPFARCPHYVRLSPATHAHKYTGLENDGFFGIGAREGESFTFSVWARACGAGEGSARLLIQLVDRSTDAPRQEFAEATLSVCDTLWQQYSVTLTAKRTVEHASLRITYKAPKADETAPAGSPAPVATPIDLDHVSLIPADAKLGLFRADLFQALADLQPGVFRFPGGCIVEGTEEWDRYQWKSTVGAVEDRPTNKNRWEYTFAYRLFADYYQSGGLGFYEYFLLSEALGAEPLPVINCGLVCQYQNDQPATNDLEPYIQDALDLIEFANGEPTTTWGALRAEMGHPEPFNLKYLAIGNEQWDYADWPAYTEHLEAFLRVLRATHPEINYIGSTGPDSEGEKFERLQPRMAELGVELYDEHFYRNEEWFADSLNRHRYDTYSRTGPKVFAGEYACHPRKKKWNHFRAALHEAAFMTGFERNADIVRMCTYAPLFAHKDGWQWRPDLIWFDNLNVLRTSSYYVQHLYAQHKGTHMVELMISGDAPRALAGDSDQHGLSASAVYDAGLNQLYIKVANTGAVGQECRVALPAEATGATVLTLQCDDFDAENTFAASDKITPVSSAATIKRGVLQMRVPSQAFQVYIVQL